MTAEEACRLLEAQIRETAVARMERDAALKSYHAAITYAAELRKQLDRATERSRAQDAGVYLARDRR